MFFRYRCDVCRVSGLKHVVIRRFSQHLQEFQREPSPADLCNPFSSLGKRTNPKFSRRIKKGLKCREGETVMIRTRLQHIVLAPLCAMALILIPVSGSAVWAQSTTQPYQTDQSHQNLNNQNSDLNKDKSSSSQSG